MTIVGFILGVLVVISLTLAILLYELVIFNRESKRKPPEFSAVRKTTIYSNHINKGEL